MSVTNIIYLLMLSFIQLSACSSSENSKKNNEQVVSSTTQSWQVVAKGNQCAIQESRQVLIKSEADFDKLWKETFNGVYMPDPKPAIDFSKKWVVAAFLGTVNTGGHSIEIKEIKQEGTTATVTLKHTKPGAGCMSSMAIEFPFVMATVNQLSSDKTEFKIIVEEKKCE